MAKDDPLLTVYGRNRFSDGATMVVTVEDIHRHQTLFEIYGADINERSHDNSFVIEALHENGTDFEHDSAKVIYLEGAGLKYESMYGRHVYFTGVLLKARFYSPDFKFEVDAETPHSGDQPTIEACDNDEYCKDNLGHLIMPYMPPKQKFEPQAVRIGLQLRGDKDA